MTTCKDCRFWKQQPPSGQWTEETLASGICGKICEQSRDTGALAETINHFGDDSGLSTDPNFGCIHGEAK